MCLAKEKKKEKKKSRSQQTPVFCPPTLWTIGVSIVRATEASDPPLESILLLLDPVVLCLDLPAVGLTQPVLGVVDVLVKEARELPQLVANSRPTVTIIKVLLQCKTLSRDYYVHTIHSFYYVHTIHSFQPVETNNKQAEQQSL